MKYSLILAMFLGTQAIRLDILLRVDPASAPAKLTDAAAVKAPAAADKNTEKKPENDKAPKEKSPEEEAATAEPKPGKGKEEAKSDIEEK